jgi:hypothetical protein
MTTICNLYPLASMAWIAVLVFAVCANAVRELRKEP